MPRSAPISRSVLSGQVKDHLLQEIMAGHFPPGARIVETRVARELGTSQAPVREALRDLEALGVVEINAFRGARVRHPTKAELLEAYGIRAELESLGARLALPRISDADLDELQRYVEEMQQAADAGDAHAEAIVDVTFHARVIQIAGNQTLERVWRYLEPLSRTYITLIVPGVNPRQVADLHTPIIAALRDRDPDLAVVAYHHHFAAAGDMLRGRWIDEPSPSDQAASADADEPSVDDARFAHGLPAAGAVARVEQPRHGRAGSPLTARARLADAGRSQ
ncbi:MAG: GntR family transcriptional regulator [Candidatus Limnocylindrales bacterium]|jgi:DNA-binding GntR family transcriptional regulator